MFSYHAHMVVGESVKDVAFIKSRLDDGAAVFDIFLLCVDPNGHNLMEIFHSTQLFKSVHARKRYTIVGVANGQLESRRLLVQMLEKHLENGGELKDFKSHFLA